MDTAKARKAMVDCQVRPNDVPDFRLQRAMEDIPREVFVPANRRGLAYVEKDIPLFDGRWLLKARDFSKLIHGAGIKDTDLVLDVGCGLGYSTAILARLGAMVVGLEVGADIVAKASERLAEIGEDHAAIVEGVLPSGYPNEAPYDVIVVAGGVEQGLDALLEQLSPTGGRLVTIMVERGLGTATLISRNGDHFGHRALFECHPAGVMAGFERAPSFEF